MGARARGYARAVRRAQLASVVLALAAIVGSRLLPGARDPNNIVFSTGANGLQSLVFNGTDYNLAYGEGLLSYVWMKAPKGAIAQFTPKCTGTSTANSVVKHCMAGTDRLELQVTYSTPASGTLRADITLANNSEHDTVSNATISTMGMRMPQFDRGSSLIGTIDVTSPPLSMGAFDGGRFLVWIDTPRPDVALGQACGKDLCKNQLRLFNIGPGQRASASFSLRLTTDVAATMVDLAPEAYDAYRKAYPSVLNWPDRRPVMAWFLADHAHISATNPRGYLLEAAMDVSNTANFRSSMLRRARSVLTSIQARPIQPQGILIWDLEGQEFIHPTTYIGDPRVFSKGYAPEMDATADELFALFRNAGLKVGVTLRPNFMQWGPLAQLPPACHSDPRERAFDDYYIAVDAGPEKDFYACYSPDKWVQIPNGNGEQTIFTRDRVQEVTELLRAKVAYARARWGTTIYYVDSTVWRGGKPLPAEIFRSLEKAFPDSLFIPEEGYIATMGAAMPYSAANLKNAPKFAPASSRYAYPTGADAVYLANCAAACWTENSGRFKVGQKIGDIAIYGVPAQMSPLHLASIEEMIATARREAGAITVIDSSTGQKYSYTGSPATVQKYPVKMRVYFANSPAALPTSTTYCENGGWAGTNTCTINLSGDSAAQVRYYDFAGNFVAAESPINR